MNESGIMKQTVNVKKKPKIINFNFDAQNGLLFRRR